MISFIQQSRLVFRRQSLATIANFSSFGGSISSGSRFIGNDCRCFLGIRTESSLTQPTLLFQTIIDSNKRTRNMVRNLSSGSEIGTSFQPPTAKHDSPEMSQTPQQREILMSQLGLSGKASIVVDSDSNNQTHRRNILHRTPRQLRRRPRLRTLLPPTKTSYFIPVKAIHIAEKIDLNMTMLSLTLQKYTNVTKKTFGNKHLKYCVYQFEDNFTDAKSLDTSSFGLGRSSTNMVHSQTSNFESHIYSRQQEEMKSTNDSNHVPRFFAVFPFGSIVFFNVPANDIEAIVSQIRKYASEPVLSGSERSEAYKVLIQEDLDHAMDHVTSTTLGEHTVESSVDGNHNISTIDKSRFVTPDYCIVHDELDMNGVAVISNIMAQTVALDTYSDTVDALLAKFAQINSIVKRTGKFTSTDRNFLFKTVAQNNSIFIDMISKTRIKDRSDTAWTFPKYEAVHYGLKNEFEIDDRFENIEFKLNLIQQNAKFFMEVMHHKSSNDLELVIVVLILAECILMMVEMSGNGERLFSTLSSFTSFLGGSEPPPPLPSNSLSSGTVISNQKSVSS